MIYITLANKGGIGKSTISAYLTEFLMDQQKEVMTIDTDPENHTMKQYKGLNAIEFNIKNGRNDVDKGSFDQLIELIIENKDKDIVIDNGASTFNPLSNYMKENDIFKLFEEEKIDTTIVGIIAGAGNTLDSLEGFKSLIENFDTKFLLFNNQLPGSTSYNGKELKDMKVYAAAKDKLVGLIEIERESDYIREDIEDMTKLRLLFSDLQSNDHFKMMQKRRLIAYRDKIWNQLKTVIG